jgi:two-component system, OmpR family, sensor histidine kinase QseC
MRGRSLYPARACACPWPAWPRAIGAWRLLRVQDDGPGIPEHDRERVFERFYCTDGGRRAPGFGMGLSLVQRVVAAHGGQVRCEAGIDGRGCGIEVRLPLRG